ncbi:MAG: hypothetical protein U5L06_12840 [Rhodovibrio sp.]|nr:hypothetical protein [Rhodovibrio sp.]
MQGRFSSRQACFDTLSFGQLPCHEVDVKILKTLQLHPEQAALAAVSKDDRRATRRRHANVSPLGGEGQGEEVRTVYGRGNLLP